MSSIPVPIVLVLMCVVVKARSVGRMVVGGFVGVVMRGIIVMLMVSVDPVVTALHNVANGHQKRL